MVSFIHFNFGTARVFPRVGAITTGAMIQTDAEYFATPLGVFLCPTNITGTTSLARASFAAMAHLMPARRCRPSIANNFSRPDKRRKPMLAFASSDNSLQKSIWIVGTSDSNLRPVRSPSICCQDESAKNDRRLSSDIEIFPPPGCRPGHAPQSDQILQRSPKQFACRNLCAVHFPRRQNTPNYQTFREEQEW